MPDGGGEGGGGRGWSGTAIAHDDLSFACGSGKGAARGGEGKGGASPNGPNADPDQGSAEICLLSICMYLYRNIKTCMCIPIQFVYVHTCTLLVLAVTP